MELKYTPGPWVQSHRKNGNMNNGHEMYSTQVYTPDGETIATIHWYPKTKNESGVIGTYREANASLISAAPDLLEVLKELLEDYECHEDSAYCDLGIENHLRDKVNAAIAKAEGV